MNEGEALSFYLTVLGSNRAFTDAKRAQTAYVLHPSRVHRCPFLFGLGGRFLVSFFKCLLVLLCRLRVLSASLCGQACSFRPCSGGPGTVC